MAEKTPILEMRNVVSAYGRIQALKGISLKVYDGEIVSIIGANGAGKSTTLMTICNIVKAVQGDILYRGERINNVNSDILPTMGLCQVPEGRRIFPRLTVLENLDMGAFFRTDAGGVKDDVERVFDLFPKLRERRKQLGGTLSGGEQQMLAMARALMSRPKVLLLDEPSMGLAPLLVKQIFDIVKMINEQGVTVVLVEQNANLALQAASRGYVLETGNVVMEDDAKKLLANPDIRKAYLGE
ncbi:MAG: ABC transporter ATP-binding protein [Pseudodesulfovibrio sp.]|jgi:branched-chain amino acid transport system ATP-binding protein|uniref:ABC transporter ATP-binding protein n=1 Tax=Pseudodesulfovibrio indicus TaxID=1716143 RepID=A0A126QK32_9BACT|nr:ABC transporter ATP-binding protein [Pseudodesulfovibrio indicus]AMK10383.1 ABC transporter ATP-binding protein [Pseudodesulfovibrio indicus]TDT89230.1 branched-chain amino acid transport system ATP-binding protein [Pseudodesulfovibrio indicus]